MMGVQVTTVLTITQCVPVLPEIHNAVTYLPPFLLLLREPGGCGAAKQRLPSQRGWDPISGSWSSSPRALLTVFRDVMKEQPTLWEGFLWWREVWKSAEG